MATNEVFDKAGSLMQATIELLKGKDLLLIYKETGVPYYWLRKFAVGGYLNPSVNRVQYLYEQLSGTNLIKD